MEGTLKDAMATQQENTLHSSQMESVKTRSYSPGETQWLVSEEQGPVKQHSYFMRTQTTTPTALFVLYGAHSAALLSN